MPPQPKKQVKGSGAEWYNIDFDPEILKKGAVVNTTTVIKGVVVCCCCGCCCCCCCWKEGCNEGRVFLFSPFPKYEVISCRGEEHIVLYCIVLYCIVL